MLWKCFVSIETLSVPSKTFLVGEYGVLAGGPALVINTEPRFELSVRSVETKSDFFAHKDSSAGLLWKHFAKEVEAKHGFVQFTFKDPWQEAGGMGRSGAEFLLVREWLLRNGFSTKKSLIQDYKKFAKSGSGADVLAQSTGLVTLIDSVSSGETKALKWPDWNLSFLIYKTGRKMKTHEHLEKNKTKSNSPRAYKKLAEISERAILAYRKKSLHAFLNTLMDFSTFQRKNDLIDLENYYLLEKIMAMPSVYFARGCGAMGFDTFLVFYQEEFETQVRKDMEKEFPMLTLVGDTSRITKGLK